MSRSLLSFLPPHGPPTIAPASGLSLKIIARRSEGSRPAMIYKSKIVGYIKGGGAIGMVKEKARYSISCLVTCGQYPNDTQSHAATYYTYSSSGVSITDTNGVIHMYPFSQLVRFSAVENKA